MLRVISALVLLLSPAICVSQDTSLVGLWYGKRRFGPDLRGELLVRRVDGAWEGSVAGRVAESRGPDNRLVFDFPSGGTFRGRLDHAKHRVVGHWIQPATMVTGDRYATPVILAACGTNCYSGDVVPLDDEYTVFMQVKSRADTRLGVFVRNPERNQGRFIPAQGTSYLVRRGDSVLFRNARDATVFTTVLRDGILPIRLSTIGFDLARIAPDSVAGFYPTGRPAASYHYRVPRALNDGWPVADARDVGLSREKIAVLMQRIINSSVDSANAYRPHAILIARHGKLAVEEYFFGEHREKPHDTRSASKTLVNIVMGAAIERGVKLGLSTPVYAAMGLTSDTLDSRRSALTMEHLLTMTSGLDCDDFNDPDKPGSEDTFRQQTRTDWVAAALGLKMLRAPGTQAVYCSINPFLASAVIARATGTWFPDLVWELLGEPLQMHRYYLNLTPQGEAYMGGGAYFRARDFLKLAQLYANGGTWNGRRLASRAWVQTSVQPRFAIGATANYGSLWWTSEYEFGGRRIRAHMASGNGGNFSVFIPDLDLVIAATGGNYADRSTFALLNEIIPKFILPAVVE